MHLIFLFLSEYPLRIERISETLMDKHGEHVLPLRSSLPTKFAVPIYFVGKGHSCAFSLRIFFDLWLFLFGVL